MSIYEGSFQEATTKCKKKKEILLYFFNECSATIAAEKSVTAAVVANKDSVRSKKILSIRRRW